MKKLVLVFAVLASTLLAPAAVDATPPENTEIDLASNFLSEDACGDGIDLQVASEVRFRTTTFFDREGAPTRSLVHADLKLVLTRVDTGDSLAFSSNYLVTVDLVTGERVFSGATFRANVPGVGPVYYDSGRKVFDSENNLVFSAGPDPDESLNTAACSFLA